MDANNSTMDGDAIDETDRLIASNKVEGTAVYNRQGDRLGTVYNFMVDKRSGRVEYAVMSFGGFLGMGERYHPLPWKLLTYDTDRGGYVVDLDKSKLEGAPSYPKGAEPSYDRNYGEQIFGYYGMPFI
ncbi:MAG: PRC-barrel domain-containing protein [Novosphingobium sp.]